MKEWKRSRWLMPLLLILAGILLEIFVFNFRHWEAYLWKDDHRNFEEQILGEGLEQVNDNLYRVTAENGDETSCIELLNIQQKLYNIQIDMRVENPVSPEDRAVSVQVKASDEANEKYFRLPERKIVNGVEKSQYMRLHLSGNSPEMLIIIHASKGQLIRISDISGNVSVPFFFSLARLLAVWGLLFAGWYLRPSSEVHRKKYVECGWKGVLFAAVLLGLEFAAAFAVQQENLTAVEQAPTMTWMTQYQLLAHSLAKGETRLEIEPGETLKSLENPYDYRMRSAVMENADESYLWDTAYYEGHYYVYFGVVPELLFFLPCYLLTGADFSTLTAVWLTCSLFMAGVFVLLGEIVKKWYRNTPYSVWLLLSLLIANGSGVWSFYRYPTFYDIPLMLGMACGVWGLAFWMKSLKGERVNRLEMAAGSFLIALIAGCRPQLVLVSALALPLYGTAIRQGKVLKEKKAADLFAFAFPVLLVAAGLMYYNQIRFGSVTDFGAAYNLTLQDMTRRKLEMGRTVFGYFTMLFQPPVITGVFPYYEQVAVKSQFYGQAIIESGFGGIMANNLILLLSLIPWKCKKLIRQKEAYLWAWMFLILGLVTAFIDIQIGGLIPRYTVDVIWLFYLAVVPVVLGALEESVGMERWRLLYGLFLLLFIQAMLFHFLTIFTDIYDKVKDMNPVWFYRVEHLIEFWL